MAKDKINLGPITKVCERMLNEVQSGKILAPQEVHEGIVRIKAYLELPSANFKPEAKTAVKVVTRYLRPKLKFTDKHYDKILLNLLGESKDLKPQRYCENCGEKIVNKPYAEFCYRCGKKIKEVKDDDV